MKQTALWSVAAALAAAAALSPAEESSIDWRTDLELARDYARESGEPLLIVFR